MCIVAYPDVVRERDFMDLSSIAGEVAVIIHQSIETIKRHKLLEFSGRSECLGMKEKNLKLKDEIEFHRQEYLKLDFSRTSRISGRMKDKLVNIEQLERFLEDGWLFVAKVSDQKAIIRGSSS